MIKVSLLNGVGGLGSMGSVGDASGLGPYNLGVGLKIGVGGAGRDFELGGAGL